MGCWLTSLLELSKIQAAICERPHESQNKKLRIMTIVCAVFTNTAALLRFATRLSSKQTFGCDDLFMAGAVVSKIDPFIDITTLTFSLPGDRCCLCLFGRKTYFDSYFFLRSIN